MADEPETLGIVATLRVAQRAMTLTLDRLCLLVAKTLAKSNSS